MGLVCLTLLVEHINPHRDFTLFAVVDDIFRSTRCPIPERQDEVRVFNDRDVALKRSGPPVSGVLRQILRQLQPVPLGILSCAGIDTSSPLEPITATFIPFSSTENRYIVDIF